MKLADLDAFMRMVTEHATRKITPLLPTTMWATVTTASPLRIRPDTADEPWPIAPIDLVGGLAEGDRVRVTIRSGQAYIESRLGGTAPDTGAIAWSRLPIKRMQHRMDGVTVAANGHYTIPAADLPVAVDRVIAVVPYSSGAVTPIVGPVGFASSGLIMRNVNSAAFTFHATNAYLNIFYYLA